MRASIAFAEARQEADLADPLPPVAAFLALACLALRAAITSLRYEVEVLGVVRRASNLWLRLLRAFSLSVSSSNKLNKYITNI